MNIYSLFCVLLCVLTVPQKVTADASVGESSNNGMYSGWSKSFKLPSFNYIRPKAVNAENHSTTESGRETGSSEPNVHASDDSLKTSSSIKNSTQNANEDDSITDGNDKFASTDLQESSKNVSPAIPISASRFMSLYNIVVKSNEFKNKYGFLLPKLMTMMKSGGISLNPFRFLSFLPYVVLAMQRMKSPPTSGPFSSAALGIENLNLASTLEDPKNINKLFSNKERGELAIDSIKLLAGQEASQKVDKLMEELRNSATDTKDGKVGINGEHLVSVLKNSDSMKDLFKTENLTNQGLNFMNAFVDSTLSPEIKNLKAEAIAEMKNMKSIRENDTGLDDTVTGKVRGTLSDSAVVFYKVGGKIINEQLQHFNSDADKILSDWKQTAADIADGGYNAPLPQRLKSMVITKTPSTVLKAFAQGNVLTNNYGYLVPQLASYFLPAGMAMESFHFICLVTYVMLIADREEITIPRIPDTVKDSIKIRGLNTDRIVDTLNDKEKMSKIFPAKDHSSVGVNMLKFVAGPEAFIVDSITNELKKITKGQPLGKLTLTDLITNVEFVKKLMAMKEFTDDKMKTYFGVDIGKLMNEVKDEMNKNYDDNDFQSNYSNSIVTKHVVNTVSAVYKVGAGKMTEQMGNINAEIQKEADKMQAPNQPVGESIGAGLWAKAGKSLYMKPVLYGVAGGMVAANKLRGIYQGYSANAVPPGDGKQSLTNSVFGDGERSSANDVRPDAGHTF